MEVPVENCEVEYRYDPLLCLNNEVLEQIFGYLDGESIIQASMVNQPWYDFIADSKQCMSKVSMTIKNGFNNDTFKILMKSKRKYVNINIKYAEIGEIFNDISEILSNTRFNWKMVKFNNTNFSKMSMFNYYMFLIEKKVEKLYISHFSLRTQDEPVQAFDFFNLKKLDIVPQNNRSLMVRIDGAFVQCQKLTYFRSMQIFDSKLLYDLLKNNEGLELLDVRTENVIDIFKFDVAHQFVFKLKAFRASNIDNSSNDAINRNFNNFLKIQATTLEEFELESFFGCNIIPTIINDMKKLKKVDLAINFIANFIPIWVTEPFVPNPSITHVTFRNKRNQFEITKAFLNGMSNVESLQLATMDQNTLEFVVEKFRDTLEEIKLEKMAELDFSDSHLFRNVEGIKFSTPTFEQIKLLIAVEGDRYTADNMLIDILDNVLQDDFINENVVNINVMRHGYRCLV